MNRKKKPIKAKQASLLAQRNLSRRPVRYAEGIDEFGKKVRPVVGLSPIEEARLALEKALAKEKKKKK